MIIIWTTFLNLTVYSLGEVKLRNLWILRFQQKPSGSCWHLSLKMIHSTPSRCGLWANRGTISLSSICFVYNDHSSKYSVKSGRWVVRIEMCHCQCVIGLWNKRVYLLVYDIISTNGLKIVFKWLIWLIRNYA